MLARGCHFSEDCTILVCGLNLLAAQDFHLAPAEIEQAVASFAFKVDVRSGLHQAGVDLVGQGLKEPLRAIPEEWHVG